MPIPLKIEKKRDPRDITLPVKYYVSTKATGEINFKDLVHKTPGQCTVTKSDCYAVLIALEENIWDALSFGQIVRFGTLGSFQINISSHGSETNTQLDLIRVKASVFYLAR